MIACACPRRKAYALLAVRVWKLWTQDSTPRARRFFNALAEEPETAAAELVPKIRNIRVRVNACRGQHAIRPACRRHAALAGQCAPAQMLADLCAYDVCAG